MPVKYRLFRKYAAVLMGLVGGALVIEGLFEMAFTYRESLQAAAQVQRAEVRAAAGRIEQYLGAIERQVVQVSALPWSSGLLQMSERRDEYHRAMKFAPAISEVRDVGADGRERLRASRSQLDEIDSGRDLSRSSVFRHARERGAYYSPAFFRQGSVPYLTLAVRDAGGRGDVTLAELNLKFVGDVVSQITHRPARPRVRGGQREPPRGAPRPGPRAAPPRPLVLRRAAAPARRAAPQRGAGGRDVPGARARGHRHDAVGGAHSRHPMAGRRGAAAGRGAGAPVPVALPHALGDGRGRARRARSELPARAPARTPDPRAARGRGEAGGRRPRRPHPHLHGRRGRGARPRAEPHGGPAPGLHHGPRAQGGREDGAARDGQPPQERVPRQHVARAAHAAERHHRLLRGAARSACSASCNAKQARVRATTSTTPGSTCCRSSTTSSTCRRSRPGRMELDLRASTCRRRSTTAARWSASARSASGLELDVARARATSARGWPTSARSSRWWSTCCPTR